MLNATANALLVLIGLTSIWIPMGGFTENRATGNMIFELILL